MHDLQLVGFTTDRRGLIFRTTAGARAESYIVPVTDELVALVRSLADADSEDGAPTTAAGEPAAAAERTGARAAPVEPRAQSQLSVREIQARLRAGEDIARVAREAGVDDAWIERFAPPVRAEQRRIVERALASHLERPRAGASVVPLRRAVGMALADKGIAFTAAAFDAAWSSRLIGHDRWAVQFRYRHRGKERTAVWDFDATDGSLTTSDRTASQLGFVGADGHHDPDAGAVIDGVIGDPDATPIGTAPPPPRRRAATGQTRAERTPGDEDAPAGGPAPAKAKAASRKATPTKASATRAPAKAPAAKKARSAKKAVAKTSSAEKAAPKKPTAKKVTAKKVTAKKAAPKKPSTVPSARKATSRAAAPPAASPAPPSPVPPSPAPPSPAPTSTAPAPSAPRRAADAATSNGAPRTATPARPSPVPSATPAPAAPARPSPNGAPTGGRPVDRGTASQQPARPAPAPVPASAPASPTPDGRRRTVQVETRRGAAGPTPPPAAVAEDGEPANPDELLRVRARRVEERLSQDARAARTPSAPAAGAHLAADARTEPSAAPQPWAADAEPEADRTAARRARAAERNAPTVQFRSGAAAPVRVAGEGSPTPPAERTSVVPPPAPRPAPADGTPPPSTPPVDANGAARPRTRRRRQLRAR